MAFKIDSTLYPIHVRQLVSSGGYNAPAAANTLEPPQLGVDYVPSLSANAKIIARIRDRTETNEIMKQIGIKGFAYIPESFSWNNLESIQKVYPNRTSIVIMKPPSQFACGACWAFSICSVLSDRYAIQGNQLNLNLSPTFIMSCMSDNGRCSGDFPSSAGKYLEKYGTVTSDCSYNASYDWCSSWDVCKSPLQNASATELDQRIPACTTPPNCTVYKAKPNSTQALIDRYAIQLDILKNGPVVTVMRIYGDFIAGTLSKSIFPLADGWAKTNHVYVHIANSRIYHYGQFDCAGGNKSLASECYMGNHAMAIVGWGIEKNVANIFPDRVIDVPYWIVRNSWGDQWNGDGYCKIAMSDPATGINMSIAIDHPITIDNQEFGAVTTIMPDLHYEPSQGIFTMTSNLGGYSSPDAQKNIIYWVLGSCSVILVICILFTFIIKPH